ncbi:unnamed protein product [Paramecium sonneborni]|uniref:Uncharacterized protein n=1 Tax=Paramecium sonneborni TaxID=65129 RepID=A0A8S1RNU5_9CILI|nr:unnamed protein product [Paramecium sonneborni]
MEVINKWSRIYEISKSTFKILQSSSNKSQNKLKFCILLKDGIFINYQYFKRDDENQRGMTIEEIMIFQKQYAKELKTLNGCDIKQKESIMEGQEHKLKLNNIKHKIQQTPFINPQNNAKSLLKFVKPILRDSKIVNNVRIFMQIFYYHQILVSSLINLDIIKFLLHNQEFNLSHSFRFSKREDLIFMFQIICNLGFLESVEKNQNIKQIKGILKKPQENKPIKKMFHPITQFRIYNLKCNNWLKCQINIKFQPGMYSQGYQFILVTLLLDIIQKLKEIDEEQYRKFNHFLKLN